MVELLVVVVIIGILISAILTASSALVGRSKVHNTRAILQLVADAAEEFKREQTARPTLTGARQGGKKYSDRYGQFPPDELEVFTDQGIPGSPPNSGSLAKGTMIPAPPYPPLYSFQRPDMEHRDLAALIVAIESFGDTSASMLGRVPEKSRSAGPIDPTSGNPSQFLDRGAKGWDAGDLQIRYILDDWGMPISYLAQRDFDEKPGATNHASSNHEGWNEASTELIRLNGGQPIFFSYGPDGKEQLTKEAMGNNAAASLVGDFEIDEAPYKAHIIDHPMNADNVYLNAALEAKLAKGIEE